MPDPAELLDVARLLATANPQTDAQLRRAASTAYYALFHKILRTAANRFMGTGRESSAGFSSDMRDFAGAFPILQEIRHLADYDPLVNFTPSDVLSVIDIAEVAMQAFDQAAPQEQADVLALMLVGAKN